MEPDVKSEFQSRSQSVAVEKVLAMKGGNGDSSYAYNSSSVQIIMVRAVKPILERAIYDNIKCEMLMGGVIQIADLGCATGNNTFLAADTIVTAMRCHFKNNNKKKLLVPEFQVHFADLPSNDFNSLLRMMPPPRPAEEAEDVSLSLATRSYFAAAVCGSHFGRLFPKQSLHFCHSSLSLHWLSQVPDSVEDRSSPGWSGKRVYVSSDCEEAVGAAYLHQFDKDLTAFLRARADEIVGGGCMLLALVGRHAGSHIMNEQGTLGDIARHLEYAFEDMVNEGIIGKEKWESFNMPFFGPNPEELKSIVEREKSFEIESVTVLRGFPLHPQEKENEELRGFPLHPQEKENGETFGRMVENHYRALFENIVAAHLGCDDLTNEFFKRIAKRAAAKWSEYIGNTIDLVVAILVRKGA